MVDTARRALASELSDSDSDAATDVTTGVREHGPDDAGRITYVQSPAEKLAFLEDGSLDLMIAGTYFGRFVDSLFWMVDVGLTPMF